MLYRGTKVALAGAFINFSLGLFYAWSVFAEGLIRDYGWTKAAAAFPYTCELLVFSVTMIFAGRFQDRMGPRRAAVICGLFAGAALILCSFAINPAGLTLLFGLLFGCASAFGYAAATPAALKWFPPEKRGLITGVVIMPMGAAALLWSPAIKLLLNEVGLRGAFLLCGLFLLAAITLAAQAIRLPGESKAPSQQGNERAASAGIDWRLLLRNPLFILLWLMLGLSTGTGVMFIGQLVQVAEMNFQVSWGYLLVSLFALTSTLGRIGGGLLCDRIGYLRSVRAALLLLAAAMLLFSSSWGNPALVAATLFLGSGYGSLYTSFPTAVGHLFGLEHFGFIYG
ncbi:MAG TPA: MFS transporter, partial [Bacillota bacterium]|nr:MFS transporter [Bacillota bacterium]